MPVTQPCTTSYSGETPEAILEAIESASDLDFTFEPVSLDTITSTTLDGTGTFDMLMRTVTTRLQEEFSKNRITGSEYAKTYLGTMQTTLQQSIGFELQTQLNNLQASQLQLANQTAEVNKYRAAVELSTADLQREGMAIQNEDAKIQVCINKQQLNILNKQETKLDKDLLILDEQLTKLGYENQLAAIAVVRSNIELITAQHTQENTRLAGELTKTQQAKLEADTRLSNQKLLTEKAQISNIVDGSTVFATESTDSQPHPITNKVVTTESVTVAEGIIGKQQALYFTQRQGFNRDSEYKMSKLFLDAYSVRATLEGGINAESVGFGDQEIAAVLQKGREGIGAELDMVRPKVACPELFSDGYAVTPTTPCE